MMLRRFITTMYEHGSDCGYYVSIEAMDGAVLYYGPVSEIPDTMLDRACDIQSYLAGDMLDTIVIKERN